MIARPLLYFPAVQGRREGRFVPKPTSDTDYQDYRMPDLRSLATPRYPTRLPARRSGGSKTTSTSPA